MDEEGQNANLTFRSTKKPLPGKKRIKVSATNSDVTSKASAVMDSALEILNEKKSKIPKHDDAETVFGQHVANSLRTLPDEGAKEYAKLKIQEILYQSRMNTQINHNNFRW